MPAAVSAAIETGKRGSYIDSDRCLIIFLKIMNKFLVAFILLIGFVVPVVQGVAQFSRLDAESAAAIETVVTEFMQQRDVVGCSVGAIGDGEVVYFDGFGYSDREAAIPA